MNSPVKLKAEKVAPKPRRSRKARGFWVKVALMLVPVLLIAGGLEAAARLYAFKKYGSTTRGMNWKFSYEPYLITTTDDRLREVPPEKGDAFRVLVLGGSTANLIPYDTLAAALEPVVGREVEVINHAQGGWILNQTRIAFLLHGMKLKPDMLISLDGANDLVTASKTLEPGITYANAFIALGVNQPVVNGVFGLLRNSQFVNSLNKLRERGVEKDAHNHPELLAQTVDHCTEAWQSLATIAKGMDIPYALVLQPYITMRAHTPPEEAPIAMSQGYRADYMTRGFIALRERLRSEPLPEKVFFIDATRAFDKSDDTCFIDEVHMSEAGNIALCRFIAQTLAASPFPESNAFAKANAPKKL